ncbi:class I SAM-dependent methyltransferase [Flavihumibacter petaseus]|uniref:Putative methyltransferase n=1 Tax=Flavihumibacter petaseus NBRC 106054 TaxID=1220578 RepID=A0A0E9N2Z9_9BACT|nr:class I SAM-dependent methyltransferase [Flavihumibacter petaseus]GAO44163.1 putative methyltransferase [Flavihumibacter petaseus NBRC 106054]
MSTDNSNGYERKAREFIATRGSAVHGIGAHELKQWVVHLKKGCTVLDLGCGTGIPGTKVLLDAGFSVYGVDAAPTMEAAFRKNFPGVPVACEPVETSVFFNRKFDAVVAIGLIFLLPAESQELVLKKVAGGLEEGGQFLFTAPTKTITWIDVLTDRGSVSLGAERYLALLSGFGLKLVSEFEDEGDNHYYHLIKSTV